jgi:hypothetical protein
LPAAGLRHLYLLLACAYLRDKFLGEISQVIAKLEQQIEVVGFARDRGVYNVEQSLVRRHGDLDPLIVVSLKIFAEMCRDYLVFDCGERIIQAHRPAVQPTV